MKPDLEEELKQCDWVVAKIRNNKTYAQNVYASLCNMQWQKQDVMPILTDDLWSCSWRYAGGLVAGIENQGGDYMDWYCSGMGSGLGNGDESGELRYVGEGFVAEEIKHDFAKLGWIPVPYDDKDLI